MTMSAATGMDEQARMVEVVDRLAGRFPSVERREVEAAVTEVHRDLDGAAVRDFVPVLVEKQARDRLEAKARSARA